MKNSFLRIVAFIFVLGLGIAQPSFSLDSTGFNPATVSVQSVGSSIPVGTVITWPSSSWPPDADNWLECNGQAINSTVYPELVGVIGWNVPNYQGVFLRGYGGQTSYHYGAVGHWSAGLGELQGDTIRNITGDIESVLNRGGYHSGSGVYSGFVSGVDYLFTTELGGGEGSEFIGRVHFDASRVAPVAQEIRPVNRAVRYLIRAR